MSEQNETEQVEQEEGEEQPESKPVTINITAPQMGASFS